MQGGITMDLYWSSFADFVAMGGYGLYVWSS
jgi:heme exporter protein D